MRLLLDTHILVWFATARTTVLRREREALAEASQLLLSAISLWEIRAKMRAERRRGRPILTIDPAAALAFCAETDICVEELSVSDFLSPPLAMDPEHGDMFDEMLLVQAQRLDARLLTRDKRLLGHPLSLF